MVKLLFTFYSRVRPLQIPLQNYCHDNALNSLPSCRARGHGDFQHAPLMAGQHRDCSAAAQHRRSQLAHYTHPCIDELRAIAIGRLIRCRAGHGAWLCCAPVVEGAIATEERQVLRQPFRPQVSIRAERKPRPPLAGHVPFPGHPVHCWKFEGVEGAARSESLCDVSSSTRSEAA